MTTIGRSAARAAHAGDHTVPGALVDAPVRPRPRADRGETA